MSNPRPKFKNVSLHHATPETRFYVDYAWWDEKNRDLQTYIFTRLDIGEDFSYDLAEEVDLVDMQTGEVRKVNGFQYAMQSFFSHLPDDFAENASLVDAAFCILLSNANQPMSAIEIGEKLGRDPNVIVKTLGGSRIYQGIRPIFDA